MQLILNKKVALFLCFTINVVHFIECSTQNNANNEHSNESAPQPIVEDASNHGAHGVTKTNLDAVISPKSEHAKNVRNAVVGGVQHNYRSSYVVNRLNRRVLSATPKQVEASSTENLPLIKAKRKVSTDIDEEVKYNVGPGVNIGVEKEKELVSVYLDEDCLKDVFTGI